VLAPSPRTSRGVDVCSSGPLLFLSHAGADAEVAFDLARRLEATPASRKAGLSVWIDQGNLARGRGWQRQLEEAIEKRSTAFASRSPGSLRTTAIRLSPSSSATHALPTCPPSRASTRG
jgi:hypothetical protein